MSEKKIVSLHRHSDIDTKAFAERWSEVMEEEEAERKNRKVPIEIKVALTLLVVFFAVIAAWLIHSLF